MINLAEEDRSCSGESLRSHSTGERWNDVCTGFESWSSGEAILLMAAATEAPPSLSPITFPHTAAATV